MRSINPKIVDYVKYYASQGHSIDRIKQFLLANNIPPQEIDEAIAQVNQSSVPVNNPTLELQLKNYIQTQLNHGYNVEVIKSALIGQGFNPNVVNKVANDLNNVNINVKHEVNVSRVTIIGIVTAIFIVGLVVFGIFNFSMFKPDESLMDITVSSSAYSYLPGENVNYQIHVTSMGTTQRFDAVIKYLIVDDAGTVITRREETLAVETTTSHNRNLQLPSTVKPGKYYLQAIADYNNKQAKSSFEFEVVEKVAEKKPITYVPPIETKPTTPTTNTPSTNNNNPNIPITPTVTSSGKTFGDVLTEVKQIAQSEPESAASNCLKLASTEQKDICFSTLADASKSHAYCDRISKIDYKDNCFLAFAIKENIDVCNKITENASKALCEQLILIQLMDKYYKENNTAMILELSKKFNPSVISSDGPQVQTYEYTYNEPVSIMDIVNNQDAGSITTTPTETPSDNNTENQTGNETE